MNVNTLPIELDDFSLAVNFLYLQYQMDMRGIKKQKYSIESVLPPETVIKNLLHRKDKINEDLLYFTLADGNPPVYMYLGEYVLDKENTITNSNNVYKEHIKIFIEYFNTCAGLTPILTGMVPHIFLCNPYHTVHSFLCVFRFGPKGFFVRIPLYMIMGLMIIQPQVNLAIDVKLLIGSAEFQERTSDLSEENKNKAIDRLLTRVLAQSVIFNG